MHTVANLLVVFGAVMALIAFVQAVAARGLLPEPTLLAAVGLLIGGSYVTVVTMWPETTEGLSLLVRPPLSAEAYLWIFLPPLLYQAALTVDVRAMLPDVAPVLLLAVVAVFVATGLIGVAVWGASGRPLTICLLLGAMVATTDPSAVINVFRNVGAPGRLIRLVEGESLLNDAAAIAIVGVLMASLAGDPADAGIGAGLWTLAVSFGGGIACGFAVGRLVTALLPHVDALPVAAATLTLAVPYPLYIAAEQMLHASGVVAVVTAGLVISALGSVRLSPRNWSHLHVIWEQVAVLMGAAVFLLAAVRVPELLQAMTWREVVYVAAAVAAALAARMAVMFGMLPALSWIWRGHPVGTPYKLAIVWGGLRGAVTLVLALGIAENTALALDDRRFIAALAAAFVLVSLFVNGTTLGWLVRRLGLTTLSPQEEAVQRQAVLLSTAEIDTAIDQTAAHFGLPAEVAAAVKQRFRDAVAAGTSGFDLEQALSERDRLSIGLVTLATREHALIPEYGSGVVSVGNLDAMTHNTGLMIDAARDEGRLGYNRAARAILRPLPGHRVARFLAEKLRIGGPLSHHLADRFELMTCRRTVLERLRLYNRRSLRPLIGERMTEVLDAVLLTRLESVDRALAEIRAEHPAFAEALAQRLLMLFALRRGNRAIDTMRAENVISVEVAARIGRTFDRIWRANIRRPRVGLGAPPATAEVDKAESGRHVDAK